MASFDIINAATQAYKTSWEARAYLVRLAIVPCILKLFCLTIAIGVAGPESDGNYLRFMLIMIPSFIADGWMLSHYVRFITFGQTWPFRASGDMEADIAVLHVRARGVLGGMIVFVLINMALGLLMTLVGQYMAPYLHVDAAGSPPEVPAAIALFSIFMLGAMFWGFRLIWLYIPFAINMDFRDFMTGTKGALSSVYMIGVWILCFVPFIMALRLIADVLEPPLAMMLGKAAASFIILIFTVLADALKGIVATAGMTYGLREMFFKVKRT